MRKKPLYSRRGWKVGDWVRVVGMPEGLEDVEEFKTLTLFKLSQGEIFRICHFDRYNHVGLEIRKRKLQFREFWMQSIYVEPHFLRRVRRAKTKKRTGQ